MNQTKTVSARCGAGVCEIKHLGIGVGSFICNKCHEICNTPKPHTEMTVEKWVDIIREWETEPYPPIRPLAEKIASSVQEAKSGLIQEIEGMQVERGNKIPQSHGNDKEHQELLRRGWNRAIISVLAILKRSKT